MTTDLFGIPTGACSIALSIAGLRTVPGDAPQPTSTIAFAAQPVNNPDIAGIGVSSPPTDKDLRDRRID